MLGGITLIIVESSTTTSKAQQTINGGVFVVFVLGKGNLVKFKDDAGLHLRRYSRRERFATVAF